jgi:hypothetical protein
LLPHWCLFASSDFEEELRGFRGGKEEAKRQNRGETSIRHNFGLGPSQQSGNTVTFLREPGGADDRFALPRVKFFDITKRRKRDVRYKIPKLDGFQRMI